MVIDIDLHPWPSSLNPALAILIAWVWLEEMPTVLSLIGGILAISGVVLLNTKGRGESR